MRRFADSFLCDYNNFIEILQKVGQQKFIYDPALCILCQFVSASTTDNISFQIWSTNVMSVLILPSISPI